MSKYEVWHDQSGLIFLNRMLPFPGAHYQHVANVQADSLETVFRLTNSIEFHWSTNFRVAYLLNVLTRSTSVGDVVVNRDAGLAWRVAEMGFDPIPLE